MADMLNIGTNALNTFKRGLEVTGHNVANINTEGYSRQRAEISSQSYGGDATMFGGAGSRVSSIERIYASYIQDQLVDAQSLKSRYEEQLSLSKQVEGVIASNDGGIQDSMQNLFNGFQELANNPTSDTQKQHTLNEAQGLRTMVRNASEVLETTEKQVNTQIKDMTKEVNRHLDSIHNINKEVTRAFSNGAQAPNDLLDQRDESIKQLSEYMDIKTFRQENGRIDIHTGNGRLPLISDNTLTYLGADKTEFTQENRTEVTMQIGGRKLEVSDQIQGGQLGGVLDFRKNMLDPAMNDLGVALNGLTASTNWQHFQGYDEDGNPGQEFFKAFETNAFNSRDNVADGSDINVRFNPSQPAGGYPAGYNGEPPYDTTQPTDYASKEAQLQNAYDDVGQLKAREYEIRADGTNFTFHDRKTGETLTPTQVDIDDDGTNDQVYKVDGLEFDLRGITNNDGDRFLVTPHKDMVSQFDMAMTDPQKMATRGEAPLPDYDDLKEILGVTTDTLDSDAPENDFDGESLEDRFDAFFGTGSFAAVAGGNNEITLAEYQDPATGIEQNAIMGPAAEGDNTNIANMASLQDKPVLYNNESGEPSETLLGGYSTMASSAGSYVRNTDIQLTSQTNVYEQISQRREEYSGVNLDEEAANLMRFQQAYQSSAQIVQTSQSLFQSLLGAVRI
ncbi:flagellar hook-associated protein FlgK [Hydrogenovibrio halophilus]|uniref:flagellar hook-associated protein FlgK n=1 Tax=Hydrogenovibrio halophilus TaxID=373391 RepID=UPI00037177FD|nr:flagellar hook-associated protein FlgK [Hydrogenovibrio halophilus]